MDRVPPAPVFRGFDYGFDFNFGFNFGVTECLGHPDNLGERTGHLADGEYDHRHPDPDNIEVSRLSHLPGFPKPPTAGLLAV